MASKVGRQLTIKLNGAVIAGVRARTLTIDNGAVDVTTSESGGFRELLEVSGERDLKAVIEGLTKDSTIIEAAANGDALLRYYDIDLYPGITFSGDFRISNIEVGTEYNDAVAFTANLDGTGLFFRWTPGTVMVWEGSAMQWQVEPVVWA